MMRARPGGYERSRAFWDDFYVPSSRLPADASNQWKYHVSGVPILGDFMRADDYTTYMNKYLKARDMTWADVKYPSLVRGAGTSARAVGSLVDTAVGTSFLRAMRNMYR